MVEQLNKEWEITGEYINTVAYQKGLINLDWEDFVSMAEKHSPISLLKISEESELTEIAKKGLDVLFNDSHICIESVILVVEIPKAGEIMMFELNEISANISEKIGNNVTMILGIQENATLSKKCRQVKFFVFGERKQ